MGILLGQKLPKIELHTGINIPATLRHTITFTYKHFHGGELNIDWTQEGTDYRLANTERSLKEVIDGWRFNMALTFTDRYLKSGSAGSYDQEIFEERLDYMKSWLYTAGYTIFAYPYQDRTDIYYSCRLTNFVKENMNLDGQPKTRGHIYTIGLSALDLITTLPAASSRPWA